MPATSSGSSAYAADPHGKTLMPEEKEKQRRRLESDQMMYTSDLAKVMRELNDAKVSIKTLERKRLELDTLIKAAHDAVKKKEGEVEYLEEELRILKKRIGLLAG